MAAARPKGGPVSAAEEEAILAALRAGRSVRDVGAEFRRGKTTVSDVARRNGLELADVRRTKLAAEARSRYAAEARIGLVSEGLEALARALPSVPPPKDMREWALAVAILIDKRRLEDSIDPTTRGGEIAELFKKMQEDEKNG